MNNGMLDTLQAITICDMAVHLKEGEDVAAVATLLTDALCLFVAERGSRVPKEELLKQTHDAIDVLLPFYIDQFKQNKETVQ